MYKALASAPHDVRPTPCLRAGYVAVLGVFGYTWPFTDVGSGSSQGPAAGRTNGTDLQVRDDRAPLLGGTAPSGFLRAECSSQGRCMEVVFPNTSMLR
jgi:hypothetical protein